MKKLLVLCLLFGCMLFESSAAWNDGIINLPFLDIRYPMRTEWTSTNEYFQTFKEWTESNLNTNTALLAANSVQDYATNATVDIRAPVGPIYLKPGTIYYLELMDGVGFNLHNRYLESPADPVSGVHVGDRDYNDSRYAPLSVTETVATAQATADAAVPNDATYATVASAATNGGAFIVTASSRTHYDTFRAAYSAAIDGQTVELTDGYFDLGTVSFDFDKPVSVIGSGSKCTLVQARGFDWWPTATNCTIKGIKFTNYAGATDDLFMWNTFVTNTMNVVLDDVVIESIANVNHTLEVSGNSIELNRVVAHTVLGVNCFVLKGCSNTVVRGCSAVVEPGSAAIGLYIKSHPTQKGFCNGVYVDDFKLKGSYVFLDVSGNNYKMNNVRIHDLVVDDPDRSYAIIIGAQITGITGNWLSNIEFDGVTAYTKSLFTQTYSGGTTNLIVRNCVLHSTATSPVDPVYLDRDGFNNKIENIQCYWDNGHYYNSEGYQKRFSNMSCGADYSKIVTADVTTTGMWICVTNGFELKEADLVVGDPVMLSGGSYDGVYRLMEWGTVDTPDVPIPGALVSNFYLRVSGYNLVTPASGVNCGNVMPGKLGWRLCYYNSTYGHGGYGIVDGASSASIASINFASPSTSAQQYSIGISAYGSERFATNSVYADLPSYYANSIVRVFPYRDDYSSTATDTFYCGIFCGSLTTESLVPFEFKNGVIRLEKTFLGNDWPGVFDMHILPESP